MTKLFREHTPIETHRIRGKLIFVKREDLFGIDPAPPLAKLRGLRLLLNEAYAGGVRLVGCWDTRVSKLGQGLAACCTELKDLKCIVSYPTKKGIEIPDSVVKAARLGAHVYPVTGGRINISFAKAREHVRREGGLMLPFGLECPEAFQGVCQEAARTPVEILRNGTLVLCCGSGVTLAGIISGLPAKPRRIVGLSSGRSVKNIAACLKRFLKVLPAGLELHEARVPYSMAETFPCPFPSHPNYDLKAWKFLVQNIRHYPSPILFWNIGA